MANTDKDILITPNVGSSSADPKIEFKGADASTSAQTITATAYPTNNGTLSFDGSAGQLFSITNDMTGTIFSVNDVSGIPSIEVDDDGTIRLAEYSGNILVGTATDDGSSKLQVNGTTSIDGVLKLETTSDQAFEMRQLSTKANDWNYISFFGRDGTRDAYVGTDADGDLMLYSDKNSSYIEMAASPNINGNVIVHSGNVSSYVGGPTLTATASGAIANGDTCVVNSDGTVSAVAATSTSPSIGSETQLENFYNSFYRRIATGGGFVVAIYKRQSSYLQARIGAVSSGSITWSSTAFTIYSADHLYPAISYDTNASRFIISWRDNLNGLRYYRAKSMAVSGTISSLSVSFGSEVTLQTGAYNSYMDHVYHPTENKTIAFNRSNSPTSIAYILTCNASTGAVTKDTNTTVNSSYGGGLELGVCYDSGEDALVFVWKVSSSTELVARAATLSGSTLTFGSEISVSGSGVTSLFADNDYVPVASDGNGNIIVAWADNVNAYGYATLLTLSGTTLTKQNDTLFNGNTSTLNIALDYDETGNNFVLAYKDNSATGKLNNLSVSGTTVTVYGTETQFDSGATGQTDLAYFSDLSGSVLLYQKGGTNYSHSNYYITSTQSTNMTTSNYIGIADAAYANAATATIQVVGSVDDAQSGLTAGQTYYIQKDGSLGTTADSPSVIAGTAVSATEIIVKG